MSFRPPRSLGPRPQVGALDVLEYEVMQEKASTLGRVTEAFETSLAAFRAFEAEDESRPGEGDEGRREALLDAAAEAMWEFVVQREACGLRNTEAVLRDYRVPAVLRLRMGVSRRR